MGDTSPLRQSDRRELRQLKTLATGDTVTVTPVDRVAHPTFGFFATVKRIVDAGMEFKLLAKRSTGISTGRQMNCHTVPWLMRNATFVSDRTSAEQSRVKARRQYMGRLPVYTPHRQVEANQHREDSVTFQSSEKL